MPALSLHKSQPGWGMKTQHPGPMIWKGKSLGRALEASERRLPGREGARAGPVTVIDGVGRAGGGHAQTSHNFLGAQLSALGELSHRWGGAPALRVALLHRPTLCAPLLGGLRLLEPLPQLCLPVSWLPPALPPQLWPQRCGEPRTTSAHLRLLL